MGVEVGIRELRDHLSAWVERVKAGEEVIVTERGKPVARLSSVELPAGYQRLIDRGILHRAGRLKGRPLPPVKTKESFNITDFMKDWR